MDTRILEKLTAFADDILIVDTNEKIEKTYETVKERLKKGGLIINRKKSEMVAKSSSKIEEIDGIPRKESFKYLGVMFEVKGEEIEQRDETTWQINRIASLRMTIKKNSCM